MTQHVAPPQGRRIIVQEVHGFTRPERLALGQHLMSPDELAMLVFRRDLHRKRLQRRYDIKLFRERFHRDMAVFEAQLALLMQAEAQRQRGYHRRYDPAQPRDAIGRWTATGGGGSSPKPDGGTKPVEMTRRPTGEQGGRPSAPTFIGTVYAEPRDGEGGQGAVAQEPPSTPTQLAQVTGSLSDVAQPLLGGASPPGEATAALPALAAGAITAALAALRAVGPAMARALIDGLFNQKTPDGQPAGIGHNSGETDPLQPPPSPPQQPPNPLPGAVGAAAALSQPGPSRDFISLRDDQKDGGHGYDRHVNISRQEMTDRVLDMARNYKGSKARDFVASRFFSEAEADALVRQVLDAHPAEVAAVRSGSKSKRVIELQFNRTIGEIASVVAGSTQIFFRQATGVRVVISSSPLSPRESYILTAYPIP